MTPLSTSRDDLLQSLRQSVQELEAGRRPPSETAWSSGCAALDRLLPDGGFVPGTLVEWLGARGSGAGSLALIAAREAAARGGAIVVLDRWPSYSATRRGVAEQLPYTQKRHFYPPAAAALGVDLENVIVVRPRREADGLWALDQALRCPGVAAVWAPLEKLDWRTFRRLQLAAEAGGGLGLLLRPISARGQPSWSEVRIEVDRVPSPHGPPPTASCSLLITRCRGPTPRGLTVEIDESTGTIREAEHHETHPLPLAAQLAHSTTRRREARA